MRKSTLVKASVVLVSLIIIGASALYIKSKNFSKLQEKNVVKTLSAKDVDNINKNSVLSISHAMSKSTYKKQPKNQSEGQVVPKIAINTVKQKIIPAAKIASKKVIVIDPGHANRSNLVTEQQAPGSSIYKIMDGGGAEGTVTHTPEYLVNMGVSIKLKQDLEAMGFAVIMTKTDNSVSLGNIDRANIGNASHAALVIRIHADSSESSSIKGASMLVPAPINTNTKAIYSESKRSGEIVLNALTSQVGMKNKGVVERDDMTGFNWSRVPVILVEMGFLSNPDEDRMLSTGDYQTKLAGALANGIQAAIK